MNACTTQWGDLLGASTVRSFHGETFMNISRTAVAVAAVLSFAAVAAPASATIVTYDWTLSSGSTAADGGFTDVGSGTLTVDTSQTKTVSGFTGELVTNLTGTVTGGATVGLLSAGTSFGSIPFLNDNYLFATGTSLVEASFNGDAYTAGIGFASSSGNFLLTAFNTEGGSPAGNNGYGQTGPAGNSIGVGNFAVTLAPVPLPDSAWLSLCGLATLGLVAVRRSRQPSGSGLVGAAWAAVPCGKPLWLV
jgi:hypothetical protein